MKEYRWRVTDDRHAPKVLIREGGPAYPVTLEERETTGHKFAFLSDETQGYTWTEWTPIPVVEEE